MYDILWPCDRCKKRFSTALMWQIIDPNRHYVFLNVCDDCYLPDEDVEYLANRRKSAEQSNLSIGE